MCNFAIDLHDRDELRKRKCETFASLRSHRVGGANWDPSPTPLRVSLFVSRLLINQLAPLCPKKFHFKIILKRSATFYMLSTCCHTHIFYNIDKRPILTTRGRHPSRRTMMPMRHVQRGVATYQCPIAGQTV